MSRIIKAAAPASAPDTTPRLGSARVLPADVYAAQTRAQAIVAAAEEQARQRLAAAQAECERIREAAELEGRREGAAQATLLIARARADRDDMLRRDERELLELSLVIAAKVLGRELEVSGAIVDLVAQALTAARRAKQVRVRLHPDDEPTVRAREPELVVRLDPAVGFALVADADVSRGSCVVETEGGRIDASLDTQLSALRRALLGEEGAP